MIKGVIGKELSIEEGQKASMLCVINILSQVKKALNGDLSKVKNCIKITGFVNSSSDFKDQPKIINPASDVLASVFEERGKHTRAAVSTNALPLGAAVEIDAIIKKLEGLHGVEIHDELLKQKIIENVLSTLNSLMLVIYLRLVPGGKM